MSPPIEGTKGLSPRAACVPADWREIARTSGAGDKPRDQIVAFVYFAVSGEWVKVGWSSNPARRMAQIRSPSNGRATLLGVIRGNRQEETALLALLSDHSHPRRGDEWLPRTTGLETEIAGLLAREGVALP